MENNLHKPVLWGSETKMDTFYGVFVSVIFIWPVLDN